MINLEKDSKLQVLLAGAITTTECPMTVNYEDASDAARKNNKTADGITNGGTAVDLLVGGSGGKRITGFSFYNVDTASMTVTIRYFNKNGTTRIIRKQTLLTLESLYWNPERGWYTSDAAGNQKTASAAADSANISTALATGVAGSSQAASIAAAIVPQSINSVSSQASSIAAAIVPASINSVSSQASFVIATNPQTVSSIQSVTSVASFTGTNWATVSSAASRVKSSFSW